MKIIKSIGIAFLGIHISTSSSLNALEYFPLTGLTPKNITAKKIIKEIPNLTLGLIGAYYGVSNLILTTHELGHYIATKAIYNIPARIYINSPTYPQSSSYLFNFGPIYFFSFNFWNNHSWCARELIPKVEYYFNTTGSYPRKDILIDLAGPIAGLTASLVLFNKLEHSTIKNSIKRPLQISSLVWAHLNCMQFLPDGGVNDGTHIFSSLLQIPLERVNNYLPKTWNSSWGCFSLKTAIAGVATIGATYLSYKLLYPYLKKSTPTTDAQEQSSS